MNQDQTTRKGTGIIIDTKIYTYWINPPSLKGDEHIPFKDFLYQYMEEYGYTKEMLMDMKRKYRTDNPVEILFGPGPTIEPTEDECIESAYKYIQEFKLNGPFVVSWQDCMVSVYRPNGKQQDEFRIASTIADHFFSRKRA
jgi:hypothetical protein